MEIPKISAKVKENTSWQVLIASTNNILAFHYQKGVIFSDVKLILSKDDNEVRVHSQKQLLVKIRTKG